MSEITTATKRVTAAADFAARCLSHAHDDRAKLINMLTVENRVSGFDLDRLASIAANENAGWRINSVIKYYREQASTDELLLDALKELAWEHATSTANINDGIDIATRLVFADFIGTVIKRHDFTAAQ